MGEEARERLQRSLQARLRKLVVAALELLDLTGPQIQPMLQRLRHLIARFELKLGTSMELGQSRVCSGKQWLHLKQLLPRSPDEELEEVFPSAATSFELDKELASSPRTRRRCEHEQLLWNCKVCRGCPHGKARSKCTDCGTSCPHGKLKYNCIVCNACPHGRRRGQCASCTPCPHGKLKNLCASCNPCPHGRLKGHCAACNPCPHGRLTRDCACCSPCVHGKVKRWCKRCKGGVSA